MEPDELEEAKPTLRFVYDKRRAIFPRKLTDGGFAYLGKVFYNVEVVSYHPGQQTRHRYVRTDRLSSEAFMMLKLSEDFTISEQELDETFNS